MTKHDVKWTEAADNSGVRGDCSCGAHIEFEVGEQSPTRRYDPIVDKWDKLAHERDLTQEEIDRMLVELQDKHCCWHYIPQGKQALDFEVGIK